MCAKHHSGTIVVVADDTDVFILLLYHYLQENLTCPLFMTSPIQQRAVIDIKATVHVHHSIIPNLLAAHALSGCDTAASFFGTGKGTNLKTLVACPDSLTMLGCLDAQLCDVIDQSTKFVGNCYNSKVKEKSMSSIRYKIRTTSSGMVPLLLPRLRHFHHRQRRSLKMSSEPIFKQQFGSKLHHLTP